MKMLMSRHMGIRDVETHTSRPRCFWGIGSTRSGGGEIDKEVTDPEFTEISDFDEEEGKGAGLYLVFEVLRALVKGRGGGWTCADGVCTSVTATLHCDGHHRRVPVPCLEVQTPIRNGDRRCREGKERRHA